MLYSFIDPASIVSNSDSYSTTLAIDIEVIVLSFGVQLLYAPMSRFHLVLLVDHTFCVHCSFWVCVKYFILLGIHRYNVFSAFVALANLRYINALNNNVYRMNGSWLGDHWCCLHCALRTLVAQWYQSICLSVCVGVYHWVQSWSHCLVRLLVVLSGDYNINYSVDRVSVPNVSLATLDTIPRMWLMVQDRSEHLFLIMTINVTGSVVLMTKFWFWSYDEECESIFSIHVFQQQRFLLIWLYHI